MVGGAGGNGEPLPTAFFLPAAGYRLGITRLGVSDMTVYFNGVDLGAEKLKAEKKRLSHNAKMRKYMAKRRAQKKAELDKLKMQGIDPLPDKMPVGDDFRRALLRFSKSLKIPAGHPKAGRPMTLPGFGLDFLCDAMNHRESFLNIARKNGKSAILAVYLLARLTGPIAIAGFRGGVVSVNREKSAELAAQMEAIAKASGLKGIRVLKSPRTIYGPHGGQVEFLSADASSGHASSFDDSIVDEIGLLQERDRPLVNGMRSAVSAKNGRFIALSIQGDSPFSAEILERRDLETTCVHSYISPVDCDLTDEEAWAASNPGIAAGIKSLAYMRDEAKRCMTSPADERHFRSFDLNAPLSPDRELICSVTDWKRCVVVDLPPRHGPCVLGIDIGAANSMTCAVALWPETRRVETWAAFGGVPDLASRGKMDKVGNTYKEMHRRGELKVFDGRTITPVPEFIRDVAEALAGEHIKAVGADRFRKAEVIQALADAGINWPIVWRGQGASTTADGSHDVRAFQKAVRSKQLAVHESLLWTSAIMESEIRYDAAGNPALDKRRKYSRIDVLQAGVIAAGLAVLTPKKKAGFRFNVAKPYI